MNPDDRAQRWVFRPSFYLWLPWAVLFAIGIAVKMGLDDYVTNLVPGGWSHFSIEHAWIGVSALFIACSLRWAYAGIRQDCRSGSSLITQTLSFGLLSAFTQLYLVHLLGRAVIS
jgi:hypothetical protein